MKRVIDVDKLISTIREAGILGEGFDATERENDIVERIERLSVKSIPQYEDLTYSHYKNKGILPGKKVFDLYDRIYVCDIGPNKELEIIDFKTYLDSDKEIEVAIVRDNTTKEVYEYKVEDLYTSPRMLPKAVESCKNPLEGCSEIFGTDYISHDGGGSW